MSAICTATRWFEPSIYETADTIGDALRLLRGANRVQLYVNCDDRRAAPVIFMSPAALRASIANRDRADWIHAKRYVSPACIADVLILGHP